MQDSVCDCLMTVQSIMHFCYFYTVAEKWRAVLKGESKDYIHASFANVCENTKSLRRTVSLLSTHIHRVQTHIPLCTSVQGYKQQKGFIIAQALMKSTCQDFWKMVYERECGVIVMLSDLVENGEVGRTELTGSPYCCSFTKSLSFHRRCATSTGLLMTPRGCRSMESSLCLSSRTQNRMASYDVKSASTTPR